MRPVSLFPLFAPVIGLKGVGARVAPLLERVAGPRVRDLVFLAPQGVIVRRPSTTVTLVDGMVQTLAVTIESHQPPRRPSQPWTIRVFDDTGFLTLTYFKGYGPHLEARHPVGAKRIVSGKAERARQGFVFQMVHPDYLAPLERADDIPAIEPIYPSTAGLPSRSVARFVRAAMESVPTLPEWQDAAWLARQGWMSWRDALACLHEPHSEADLSPLAPARRRLAFDELLAHQLALAQRRKGNRATGALVAPPSSLAERAEAALPFRLTSAQARAVSDIRHDLASGLRMTRLVQGDVGSGKTVVALLAMIDVAAAGGQSVLMAPTEILARQHAETLRAPLAAAGLQMVLLTGRQKTTARADVLAALASGEAAIAIGTHALFQDDVSYRALALTVIDEQHRFGVTERRRLSAKGEAAHLLALSATPIPRTLELTLFGDLDISRIDEKPPGRKPVATRAAPLPRLSDVLERLETAVREGAQAFWICPLIEDPEGIDVAAAEARWSRLTAILGKRVGLVHGRLPPSEKDAVMARFAAGLISVLVATTVVEVGVDVPEATIMIIEQAERFGLAQLHQLRGRVGRGGRGGSCVLLYDPPLSEIARQRIEILRQTEDGFLIAEKDLELRGGGDPLGLAQSGLPTYRFADPAAHRDLIAAAADDARLALIRDPELTSPRGEALRCLSELFDWRADDHLGGAG